MSTGINVDPLNMSGAPAPSDLRDAGFRWVRLVSRKGVEDYVSRCQASGIMVLAVVTDESQGYVFGGPDVWQYGNEPDQNGVPAQQYQHDFNFYQSTYPQLTWIAAGLASGQPQYWKDIQDAGGLNGCSGFSVHPYAKKAIEADLLLSAYKAITPDMPLWISEWNRPTQEIAEFSAMLRAHAVADAWFCWSDGMVQGYGLSETAKRLLASFGGTGFPFV